MEVLNVKVHYSTQQPEKMFSNWWTNTAQRCLHLSTKVLTRNVRRGNHVMWGKLFRPITSFVSNLKLKRCTTEFLHDKFSQTIAPAMVFIHNFVFRIKRSVMWLIKDLLQQKAAGISSYRLNWIPWHVTYATIYSHTFNVKKWL